MSQSTISKESRVVPAQVDFLAIYNPTLGASDETLREQLVYYYTRSAQKQREKSSPKRDGISDEDEEENKRLRQIGLAQGMVNFANNFSSRSNVDSIETEKSRIILYELEQDWWILASIDLTRLPVSKISREDTSGTATEYSAREVAPAQLLISQLSQANTLFLLHHATRLQELFSRVGRDKFCGLLERYWNKFLKEWDVLLHGNPAVDIYNATKLGGGGELGIGVGEEEWGSGEREVLEGFIDRTTGLQDLIVGRYGLAPGTDRASKPKDASQDTNKWLGAGNDAAAADGIIFSGTGLVSKTSLCTLSKWMEDIFKYGEEAYGVADNPSSRPRAKRKGSRTTGTRSTKSSQPSPTQSLPPTSRPGKKREHSLRKQAIENNAAPPGIPAPLVGQVGRSSENALNNIADRASDETKSATKSQTQGTAADSAEQDSSTFGTDNMMKYLTLGYGKSWTLNPKGFKSEDSASGQKTSSPTGHDNTSTGPGEESGLQVVDPTPEVSEEEQPFRQKLEQSIGRFLIGLSGDLEQAELDIDTETDSDSAESRPPSIPHRLFLRTLTIEQRQPSRQERNTTIRSNSFGSTTTTGSKFSGKQIPPTSAQASIDGAQPNITHEKVQVAIYVHQPFMFVFLFELHTPNLTIPSFYRSIHNQLGPLQKSLLRSTDPTRIVERIATAMGEKSTFQSARASSSPTNNPIYDLVYDPTKRTVRTSIPNIPIPGSLAAEGLTSNTSSALSVSGSWYTLGIPIGSQSSDRSTNELPSRLIKSAWSRTEALNAHTQILNTYLATRSEVEFEHTAKTSRGWWILWMKVPSSRHSVRNRDNDQDGDQTPSYAVADKSIRKEAFLVRKAVDFQPPAASSLRGVSGGGPGRWLLREQRRDVSGASSAGGNIASAKGVSEGMGVDAKKWVEGLLTLTQ